MRHGEVSHVGRTTVDTVHVAPAAMVLVDVPKIWELPPPPLALRTYR
jgi:hypothetical protein